MKFAPLAVLAVLAALIPLALPAPSRATVRSVTRSYAPPAQPPSLTPQPPVTETGLYLSRVSVSYDDAAGAVTFDVGIHNADRWSHRANLLFALDDACADEALVWRVQGGVEFSEEYDGVRDVHWLKRGGYVDRLPGVSSITPDGFRVEFRSPGLTGMDLRCVQIDRDPVTYFAGYEPVKLNGDNALTFFRQRLAARFPELPADATAICPAQSIYIDDETDAPIVSCWARWRFEGEWVQVYWGLTDGVTTPEPSGKPYVRRWTRTWTREPAKCLKSVRVKGRVWSNFDACPALMVSDVDYARRTGRMVRYAYEHGTNTAGFAFFVKYRCKRWGTGYECRNQAGDAFRWKP